MVEKNIIHQLGGAFVKMFTQYQSAITEHGVKSLAYELKKSKGTLYAEMSLENLAIYLETIENYDDDHKKPSYLPKQGLVDFVIGMKVSGDTRPLQTMAAMFDMACFNIPDGNTKPARILKLIQNLNKECSEGINKSIESLDDSKVSRTEAKDNIKELLDVINAAGELKAYYESVLKKKA